MRSANRIQVSFYPYFKVTEPVFSIHGASCASYTREFTDSNHANVSNDEAGAHSTNPGRRRGDKDLCPSKEGAGSPVSTQKRERATQMCSEATAVLLH